MPRPAWATRGQRPGAGGSQGSPPRRRRNQVSRAHSRKRPASLWQPFSKSHSTARVAGIRPQKRTFTGPGAAEAPACRACAHVARRGPILHVRSQCSPMLPRPQCSLWAQGFPKSAVCNAFEQGTSLTQERLSRGDACGHRTPFQSDASQEGTPSEQGRLCGGNTFEQGTPLRREHL